MSDAQQPVFSIEKIYVKDLSVEVPAAPQVFLQPEQSQLEVQLEQQNEQVADGLYEVTLTVTVTAKSGAKTLFLVEAAQAGIFQIRNVGDDNLGAVIGMLCPNVLFPYARETVSDTVNRAGFPPVNLAPVNFEAIYQQRLAQQQAQAPQTAGAQPAP
ncbi:MAG TPA: protein-export chaperone SecB [Burkholderiales bacterium]|jgi:preprotein translocase subunit SecB|nr:protein-export chaperone SecB [Burkholderiales bacterium]